MMVWGHIVTCLENGDACALVTVAGTAGSTPRERGARMVVRADGGFHGTIGGGTLEFEAIRKAADAARNDLPMFHTFTVSLGPDLGQCCGGRADLALEVFTAEYLDQARSLAAMEREGHAFSTRAVVSAGVVGAREVVESGAYASFALTETHGRSQLQETFGDSRRPLYLFGAGHVGKALVLALAPLPFSIVWVDSRADQFPAAVPQNVTKIASADPGAVLDRAPEGAFVIAMTHSHAVDEDIMARALLSQKFSYCGVIGSATKRTRFLKRLRSRGLDDGLLAEMVCPIGVPAIRSKHPSAIAAGIAVDLLERDQARFQHTKASRRLAQK